MSSRKWIFDRVWCPQPRKHFHSTSSAEFTGHGKNEPQGLLLAQVKSFEGIFPLCNENRNGAGVTYQVNMTITLCALIPHTTSSSVSQRSYIVLTLTLMAHVLAKPSDYVQEAYIWEGQNSWPGNKTKPPNCQSQSAGVLYQIFCNLFCSHALVETHRRGRCADANKMDDKHQPCGSKVLIWPYLARYMKSSKNGQDNRDLDTWYLLSLGTHFTCWPDYLPWHLCS